MIYKSKDFFETLKHIALIADIQNDSHYVKLPIQFHYEVGDIIEKSIF